MKNFYCRSKMLVIITIGLLTITGCSFYPAIIPVEPIEHKYSEMDDLNSGVVNEAGQSHSNESDEHFEVDFEKQPIIDITTELEQDEAESEQIDKSEQIAESEQTDQVGQHESEQTDVSEQEELPAEQGTITEGEEEQKVIALTFDDGPDLKYTPQVLDILLEKNIKATFFLVGVQINKYPEVVMRMVDEGHLIANHTYYHPNLTKLSEAEILKELDETDKLLESIVGFKPEIVRPPYGAINKEVRKTIEDTGRTIVMWNIDPRDWASTPVEDMYENVMTNAKDEGNILFHSFGGKQIQNTVDLLPDVIDSLTEKGYTFVTVDEYIVEDE